MMLIGVASMPSTVRAQANQQVTDEIIGIVKAQWAAEIADPANLTEQFKNIANVDLDNKDMEVAWCAMLGLFPKEVLDWLTDISQRYNIYLFSNTNRIHHRAFQRIYKEQTGKENFDDYFIKAWYSHDLGLRKPYAQAFTKLLEIENLKASETLFIDDSHINIEGANEAGLLTTWLKPPMTVLELGL